MTDNREKVEAVLEAIKEHQKAKKQVTDALKQLSRDVEGIVIDKMESEYNATIANIVGRSIIIGVGTVSLIMLANPVTAAASPLVGLAGTVIGYAIVGGSKYYQMSVREKHAKRVKKVHEDLLIQLEKYAKSQAAVFDTFDIKMALLTEGKDIKKNLNRIRDLVEEIENESNGLSFKALLLFIEKAKAKYISLSQEQKKSLHIEDFVVKAKELMKVLPPALLSVNATNYTAAASAIGGVINDVAGAGMHVGGTAGASVLSSPWLNVFQGINIAINGIFLINDIDKYLKLKEMKGEGWSVKRIFQKTSDFNKEQQLRDLIEDIRDEILEGY